MLDDIARSMPAMLEATKLGSRAAKVGFDWPSVDGLFDKLAEETGELRDEIAQDGNRERSNQVEEELGDLLFTTVNLARHVRVEPEFALRRANAKFRKRFGAMEAEAGGREKLDAMSAEELERLWERAKRTEGTAIKTEPLAGEKN
jgi:XTP/dITP diphosphohydrolase/ATP diphosphatase